MKFYKFRSVGDDLESDYAIEALLKSYAVFSSRKNFNDVLDSKINILRPTPEQMLELGQDPRLGASASALEGWTFAGSFTAEGERMLIEAEDRLNKLFDSYPVYSVSSHADQHLLWAHYASSHTGFCIELDFPASSQPIQVRYRTKLGTIQLLDLFRVQFGLIGVDLSQQVDFGQRVLDALHVKLDHWKYEGEYRWIASRQMGYLPEGEKLSRSHMIRIGSRRLYSDVRCLRSPKCTFVSIFLSRLSSNKLLSKGNAL